MIPFTVTGCTYTGGCWRYSNRVLLTDCTATLISCYDCAYHRDNQNRHYIQKLEQVPDKGTAKERKSKQLRDGLKNLPGNRKNMRW